MGVHINRIKIADNAYFFCTLIEMNGYILIWMYMICSGSICALNVMMASNPKQW